MIKFVIKAFFWIGLFIVILPADDLSATQRPNVASVEDSASAFADQAITSLTGLCLEKPDLCQSVYQAAAGLGTQAYQTALTLFNQWSTSPTPSSDLADTQTGQDTRTITQ